MASGGWTEPKRRCERLADRPGAAMALSKCLVRSRFGTRNLLDSLPGGSQTRIRTECAASDAGNRRLRLFSFYRRPLRTSLICYSQSSTGEVLKFRGSQSTAFRGYSGEPGSPKIPQDCSTGWRCECRFRRCELRLGGSRARTGIIRFRFLHRCSHRAGT